MGSPEGKTGETGVIERGAAARIEPVALFASERQLGRPVIQDLVVQVVVQVTGGTFGAQAHVPPRRGLLVAGTAVYRGVRPKEGKAILMLSYRLHRYTPAANRVAGIALAAELPFVNVGVAVGALRADVAEDQFGVTTTAADRHMESAEWKAGFHMVKVGDRPDRFPAGRSVTVLAGDGQRAVGTSGAASHGLRISRPNRGRQQEQENQGRGHMQARRTVSSLRAGMNRYVEGTAGVRPVRRCPSMRRCDFHPALLASGLLWQALQSRAVGLYMTTLLASISFVEV
jgi:hypothetical protein